jgi:4-amino-4-deoxy-L-arabinose transferase-like glycosyltransferase
LTARVQQALRRLAGGRDDLDSRELWLLVAAIALGLAVRILYVLLTRHLKLAGDEPEYDVEGQLIAHGHLFWTTSPYGLAHASAWKAPGYPAWVGLWYTLLGHHPLAVRFVQVPLGVLTIGLSWALARRLFGRRVAIVAAFVVALYPNVWQFEELLYPEALAIPLMLAALLVIFGGPPTRRRAILSGVILGISLYVRPSGEFVLLGALVAWGLTVGWRRGIVLTAIAAAVAIATVAPWTIRNAVVMHGFLPISMQDAAAYGTFNSQAANDPVFPYAWRDDPPSARGVLDPAHHYTDLELHSKLLHLAWSYIKAHPIAVPEAFFWNGLSRLWDIRRRSRSLVEVQFEGRSRPVTEIGLYAYYLLLPLALVGLWRARRRRALTLAILAIALGASITFTVEAGTRYRAPLEPLIAVLACAGALGPGAPEALAAPRSEELVAA